MIDFDLVDEICEVAERDGERPPPPSWHRGAYPAIEGCTADGNPVRGFERDFPTGYRDCYVDVYCQDVLAAQGAQRSPTVVHVAYPSDGATPAQARAIAAALIQAAGTAEAV